MEYVAIALTLAVAGLGVALAIQSRRVARFALAQRLGPVKRLEALELALSDLDERHGSLLASFKRLQARVGMREARAALKDAEKEPEGDSHLQDDLFEKRQELQRMLATKIRT